MWQESWRTQQVETQSDVEVEISDEYRLYGAAHPMHKPASNSGGDYMDSIGIAQVMIGIAQVISAVVLAFLTYLLWRSTNAYSKQVEIQTSLMERTLQYNIIESKREVIIKEMDFLILPLMTIFKEIDLRGIDTYWNLYIAYFKRNATDPIAAEKFASTVDCVDQHKYLAPTKLYPLIEDFVAMLRYMKISDSAESRELLREATKKLFFKKPDSELPGLVGGLVAERYYELTRELQALNTSKVDKPFTVPA